MRKLKRIVFSIVAAAVLSLGVGYSSTSASDLTTDTVITPQGDPGGGGNLRP